MYWFTQFVTSPVRSLLGLIGMVVAVIILLLAIAYSPHGAVVLGGIWATLLLLLAVRIPMRFVLTLGALAFVIVGVANLVAEVMASGVVELLLLVCGLLALGYAWRWARAPRHGWYSPSHRPRYRHSTWRHRRRWPW